MKHCQFNHLPPLAVIGTGRVARAFLRQLRDWGVPLAGVVSAQAGRADEMAREFGTRGFQNLEDLRQCVPSADLALVVNANPQHFTSARQALEMGFHVFCEKPMAVRWEECVELVQRAHASRGSLQINFEYFYSKMPQRLNTLLQEGALGELVSASCVDSRGHWWSDPPDADPAGQVRLRRDLGGGIVFHCGVHQLDLLRRYFGGFRRVQAFRSNRNSLPYYPSDVPDHLLVVLTTADGRVASLEIFHNRAPCWYRRTGALAVDWAQVPGHEFRLSLMGTEGACLADFYGARLHLFRYHHAIKDVTLERTEDYGQDPQNELHHDMTGFLFRWLERIAEGSGPVCSPEEALATTRLAFAAEESILTGQPVELEP